MCDVSEDKLAAEQLMINRKKNLCSSNCMKCKEVKATVVVRGHDPLCRSCFLIYTTHKFRSTLGKSRLIQANDKVLLALSGGHSSTAMLHLVKEALSLGAHKRLKFYPGVVFIDESSSLPEDTKQDSSHVQKMTEDYGYPFFTAPIDQNFRTSDSTVMNESDDVNRHQFCEAFNSISTLSAKTEFLVALRMVQIINIARKYNYTKVMTGENATTLSMKLLCNVAQGRGATIPIDIGVSDKRYPGITIIRPMREFSSKETALYNRTCGINVTPIANINTMVSSNCSLQRQTEEFITGLQAEFPSTVNTVFRTGDKICMNENLKKSNEDCVLCQSPLLIEDVNKEKTCISAECCGSSDECTSTKFRLSSEEIKSQLCYGCNLTFKEMGNRVELLPEDVLRNASTQIKRNKMKESIQEFLLDT